jgi:hypothetical protein
MLIVGDSSSVGFLRSVASDGTVAILTVLLTGLVGAGLTLFWNVRQKRREMDLAAAERFASLYGEFFATWKVWNSHVRERDTLPPADRARVHADILSRATTAEAGVESTLVRLAAQRDLHATVVEDLGRFRQGYQALREVIRSEEPLDWFYSDHPEYKTFKRLAIVIAALIDSGKAKVPARIEKRTKAWLTITSNKFEDFWIDKEDSSLGGSRSVK